MTKFRGLKYLAAGLLALPLWGCTGFLTQPRLTSEVADTRPPVDAVDSPEDEIVGARENPRIVDLYGGIYAYRPAEVMLTRIVSKLLAAAGRPNTRFTLTILDSGDINAFALPGGYVYVTRGILALANDQSELAAVLAHEIAHVVLKHARARTNRIRTTELVGRLVTGVFGQGATTEQIANSAKVSLASFTQTQELAADREGIVIAGQAGFDPHAAARFLGAMGRYARRAADEGGGDFLSSHPSTPDRVQKATEAARGLFGAPGLGTTGRDDYLTAIDGLAFGETGRNGVVVGQRYVHARLGVTFAVPAGYALRIDQDAVVGIASATEAMRFDHVEIAAERSLDDYVRSGWIRGLKPETIWSQTSNGLEAVSAAAVSDGWAFRIELVRLAGRVYRFIFAARDDSASFAKHAGETHASFRAASPADFKDVKSLAIRRATAGPHDSVETLGRRMANGGRELFLALNNLAPNAVLTPNTSYKLVVAQ